jgi:hypothetical protein
MSLAVDALAAFRLTRLVIEDTITEPLRQRVKHRAMREVDSPGTAAKVETLLSCPWCVGFWVSCGVVAARRVAPRSWVPLAEVLALSAAVGIIAENT